MCHQLLLTMPPHAGVTFMLPRLQNDQLIVEGTPETVTVPSAVITCAPRVRSSVRRSDAAEKTRDDTSCSFEFTVEILRNA